MRCDEFQHGTVKLGIGANNAAGFKVAVTPFQIGHDATGFLHQQDARGHVPGFKADLPKAVKAARCYISEVECRRAGSPDAGRILQKTLEHGKVSINIALVLERDARS